LSTPRAASVENRSESILPGPPQGHRGARRPDPAETLFVLTCLAHSSVARLSRPALTLWLLLDLIEFH
jgi:hypothetical protein